MLKEHFLFPKILFNFLNSLRVSVGKFQVVDGLVIHGEETNGCSVFRGHVTYSSSIRDG